MREDSVLKTNRISADKILKPCSSQRRYLNNYLSYTKKWRKESTKLQNWKANQKIGEEKQKPTEKTKKKKQLKSKKGKLQRGYSKLKFDHLTRHDQNYNHS